MAHARLTEAEARVMRLAAAGFRTDEIAEALNLTPRIVAWHLAQSYRKLGLRTETVVPEAESPTAEEARSCGKSH
jgi:DNA-binding CsgD family transcriptional regulator